MSTAPAAPGKRWPDESIVHLFPPFVLKVRTEFPDEPSFRISEVLSLFELSNRSCCPEVISKWFEFILTVSPVSNLFAPFQYNSTAPLAVAVIADSFVATLI